MKSRKNNDIETKLTFIKKDLKTDFLELEKLENQLLITKREFESVDHENYIAETDIQVYKEQITCKFFSIKI